MGYNIRNRKNDEATVIIEAEIIFHMDNNFFIPFVFRIINSECAPIKIIIPKFIKILLLYASSKTMKVSANSVHAKISLRIFAS
jgi:hypothetical protein